MQRSIRRFLVGCARCSEATKHCCRGMGLLSAIPCMRPRSHTQSGMYPCLLHPGGQEPLYLLHLSCTQSVILYTLTLLVAAASAPSASSFLTTSRLPLYDANSSGVSPSCRRVTF
jgi:hypothetical protein